jgi:CRP-like cAMP-binding protein
MSGPYRSLSRIWPLTCLNEQEFDLLSLGQAVLFKSFEKGEIIHLQHEVCRRLDVILEGEVIVQSIDEQGNVLTVQSFAERELLGANLIFASRRLYPMTVMAEQKTQIAQIDPAVILTLCQRNLAFMSAFFQAISDRSVLLTDRIQSIAFKSIRQALLDFIRYESIRQDCPTIRLPITKKALAERLGIERTSLSRELRKMHREGLVDYDARTITWKGDG